MMITVLSDWTNEKVTQFAPDAASVKASQKLARPQKWQTLGHDQQAAWGEMKGSGKNPYQVSLDLVRLQKEAAGYRCTCPSRKHPCKHVLALLFILADAPNAVSQAEPPEFVTEWLEKAAQRARRREARQQREQQPADPQQQTKTAAARKESIMVGLAELEPWLINLLRHGLASDQVKEINFWEAKAARMVDAQAPGVAAWLRSMATIPNSRQSWMEALLVELGQLYLLLQSFKRFDDLPPETQADLRSVVGWQFRQETLLNNGSSTNQPPIQDRWLVMGKKEVDAGQRLRLQRGWLRGQTSQRDALILEFAFGNAPFETRLYPGAWLQADLIYFPSRYPLRAFIHQREELSSPSPFPQGQSVQNNIEAYAQALAQNPWLRQCLFSLAAVVPVRQAGQWIVREAEGQTLPLSPSFAQPWRLFSLSGHHPLHLIGEWDGQHLTPLGAIVAKRFVDFSSWGVS
ncbi:MAG: SWIM zinc finger family protein [Chloroflexota bacterium]